MAAIASHLTSGSAASPALSTSQATASVTPTAGAKVVVNVLIKGAGVVSAVPTFSGTGISGVGLVKVDTAAGSNKRVYQLAGVSDGSATVITIARTGTDTWDFICWSVEQVVGTSGAVPNNTIGHDDSTTVPETIAYAQAFAAGSCGIAVFAYSGGGGSATPKSGWTEVCDVQVASECFLQVQIINGADTTAQSSAGGAGYDGRQVIVEWASSGTVAACVGTSRSSPADGFVTGAEVLSYASPARSSMSRAYGVATAPVTAPPATRAQRGLALSISIGLNR